jgi:hypothetical protein
LGVDEQCRTFGDIAAEREIEVRQLIENRHNDYSQLNE